MKKIARIVQLIGLGMMALAVFCQTDARAQGEIVIEGVSAEQRTPTKYLVVGKVRNRTQESREVILRAQVVFYDKAAPKGDVPAANVWKDVTLVIWPNENRKIEIPLILEGGKPAGSLRMEPGLRLRRQREWMYE